MAARPDRAAAYSRTSSQPSGVTVARSPARRRAVVVAA
jgi:hypothetical protein